ncbi:MAG: hypothetical protein WC450_09370 [Candidatus Omnitrophota bacterium]|jgi:hypothetical protein
MNTTNHPSIPIPKKDELIKFYEKEKKSTWEIARVYNVSQMQIRRWLIRMEIRPRSYAEASKITRNGFKEGNKHPNWKGNNVSYQALHTWVTRHKGSPQRCEDCGTTEPRKYEWANISGKYKRDLNDWKRLCTKCHRKFDKR